MKKKASLPILILMISSFMFTYSANAFTGDIQARTELIIDGKYNVTLIDVEYNEVGNKSKWIYNISSTGSPAISHILFEDKIDCDPLEYVIVDETGGTLEDGYVTVEIGYDLKTDKDGIKFEFHFTVDPEPDEWYAIVWFTLEGIWVQGTVEVFIKAGHDPVVNGWPEGPDCGFFVIPEVPYGTISILITALIATALIARKQTKLSPITI